ncbi:MAG TPA: hypothetical protein VEK57_31930 [Thermoanaerobaculia bacterium]|nr:hypothetical protein [Thermoanaerobaculia bacterium]
MRRATLILTVCLLTVACGSGGLGSLGDILGSPSAEKPSDVRGTVDNVDTNARSITLNVSYVNNLRSSGNDQRGTIYYDNDTRVVYQNQNYNVTDLERGDQIDVTGHNDSGRYVAETITVTQDVTR